MAPRAGWLAVVVVMAFVLVIMFLMIVHKPVCTRTAILCY